MKTTIRNSLSFARLTLARRRVRSLLAWGVGDSQSREKETKAVRKSLFSVLVPVCLVLFLASGCGRRAAQTASGSPDGQAAGAPLAEWAPKNPSPEFLRAARVLKPMAEQPGDADEGDLARKSFGALYKRTLVPAWEFFGTLSDEQIERFLATQDLQLQVKDLSEKQRAALYRYFDVWREQMKGLAERPEEWGQDWLVDLYKFGANEDLSNVQIEFLVRGGHRVAMILRVRQPDGSLGPPCPAGIGDI